LFHTIFKIFKNSNFGIRIDYIYYLFNSTEFCDFLKNTKYLQGLRLISSKDNFKFRMILQGLTLNKTIKFLALEHLKLGNFKTDFISLISSNTLISTLFLRECSYYSLKVDLEFIEAVLKNKKLLYLILEDGFIINRECASKLGESNLRGIKFNEDKIDDQSKEIIYRNIHKIESYSSFDKYEI